MWDSDCGVGDVEKVNFRNTCLRRMGKRQGGSLGRTPFEGGFPCPDWGSPEFVSKDKGINSQNRQAHNSGTRPNFGRGWDQASDWPAG